jgi:hypothetical protein
MQISVIHKLNKKYKDNMLCGHNYHFTSHSMYILLLFVFILHPFHIIFQSSLVEFDLVWFS